MALVNNIAVIILAAGESSRLGSPKQLLQYDGKTLLGHTIQVARDSIARPVVVVLGSNEDLIKTTIDKKGLHIVVNKEWEEGMASSLRCGIKELLRIDPLTTGAVIMLCDQPFVTAFLVNELASVHEETGKEIIASSYGNILGAPTFFHKNLFPELLLLKGDVGAKAIIRQHPLEVQTVDFSKGHIDIDTTDNHENLVKTFPPIPPNPIKGS